jgi:hypothetical protein
VLVVRVWLEAGDGPGLRARITRSLDLAKRDESAAAAASPDEVLAIVRAWLDEFVARASPPVGDDAVTGQ